ncbi:uncharacterized protein LOC112519967 [Cynara cardunculus var. scolymus]|uniref:uncharacterized protein LOC112519967 n=1 Tax=Cynara cardunculus var. scolymus TaxID=59895 RepID=UPI000D62B850|nr:uncharacterized protein LOC112519967 [Cynara cardunculus var. scolymus]
MIVEEKKLLREEIDEFIHKGFSSDIQERNVKQIQKNEELTEKFHKAENELIAEKKLLEKEKDKLIEAEKKFDAERKSFESNIKALELNATKLSKQISDFKQIVILERAKFDIEKKEYVEECQKKHLEIFDSIAKKQKTLNDERKVFALEKKNIVKKNAAIAKELIEKKKWLDIASDNDKGSFEEDRKEFEKERKDFEKLRKELEGE